jgi:hypothetical protein
MKFLTIIVLAGMLAAILGSEKIFTIQLTRHERAGQVQVTNKLLDTMVSLEDSSTRPLTSGVRQALKRAEKETAGELERALMKGVQSPAYAGKAGQKLLNKESKVLQETLGDIFKAFAGTHPEDLKKPEVGEDRPVVETRERISEKPVGRDTLGGEPAKQVADKTKTNADKTKTNADKTKTNADKTKTNADKTKTNADKTKTNADKPKTDADKPKTDADKPKTDADKPKTDADKPKTDADKPKTKLVPRVSSFRQYLFDFKEIQFVGQIAMGSKRLIRKVIFDSGSSILWVSNSRDSHASKKRTFDCGTSSTTCKPLNRGKKSVEYGSGSIDGDPVSDDIYIPGVSRQNSNLKNFKSEQSKEVEGAYMDFTDPAISWGRIKAQEFDSVYNSPGMSIVQADGVLGMGPNDDPDIKSVMTTMFEQKIIEKQQFAFFYSIDENSKPSSFTFGGYDKSIVAKSGEEINWLPRVGDVHWTSALERMKIGQASISTGGSEVLFDSGSSWIILFPMDFEVLYAAGMQNSYTCGSQGGMLWCEKDVTDSEFEFEKLPQIEFTFKGKVYVLDYKLLLAQCQVKNQDGRIIRGCLFKIRAMEFGIRVLGMPFLQQNYVIFDRDTQSIGKTSL